MIQQKGLIVLLISAFLLPSKSKASYLKDLEFQVGASLASQVGLKVKKDFSNKYFATLGIGYLPSFLASMSTSMSKGFGFVDAGTGDVLEDALANSFLIDFRVAYKLSRWKGFYVDGAYSFHFGGGSETTESTLDHSVLPTVPYNFLDETPMVSATLHNIAVHLGYIWEYQEDLTIYSELGLEKPLLGAVDVNFDRDHVTKEQDKKEIEEHVSGVLTQKYLIPSFSVWLSYKFR